MTRRQLVIGAGIAASGATAWLAGRVRLPDIPRHQINLLLPQTIPPWSAGTTQDAILSPDALTNSIYDEVVARRYTTIGRSAITVVAAYGLAQSYATQLHRPEICYPASGFQILSSTGHALHFAPREIPARIIVARRGVRTDCVMYWSRIGNSYPGSLWHQRRAILAARVGGEASDGILVRISCSNDVPGPVKALDAFAETLWSNLSRQGREKFFGIKASRAKA